MERINARVMNRIGTESEWQTDDPVILKGEIAFTITGSLIKMKVGDGTKKYSQLDFNVFDATNFKGEATPATNPGTPTKAEIWIAEPGTYPNFGGQIVTSDIGYLVWDGNGWSVVEMNIDLSEYVKRIDMSYFENKDLTVNDGAYVADNGTVISNIGYRWVEENILGVKRIKITSSFIGIAVWSAIFKNSLGVVIQTRIKGNESTPTINDGIILDVPELTQSVVLNAGIKSFINLEIEKIPSNTKNEDIRSALTGLVSEILNVNNYVFIGNDGNENTGAGYFYRYVKTEIPKDRKLFVSAATIGGILSLAIYFDIQGNYLSREEAALPADFKYYNDFALTIPEDAYYVAINSHRSYNIVVKKNDVYKPFQLNTESEGKNALIAGDSFVAEGVYVAKLNSLMKFSSVVNGGIGGSRITQVVDGDNALCNRVANYGYDFDYINILAVTNDIFANVSIGNVLNVDGSYNFNKNELCGALNFIFNDWFTNMENKQFKILFTIPTMTYKLSESLPFYDAIIEVCRLWSVPVCDLSSSMGVNSETLVATTRDSIHPKEFVYLKMAERAAFCLRNLMY